MLLPNHLNCMCLTRYKLDFMREAPNSYIGFNINTFKYDNEFTDF